MIEVFGLKYTWSKYMHILDREKFFKVQTIEMKRMLFELYYQNSQLTIKIRFK